MRMNKKALIPILVCALLTLACSYIVLPEKASTPKAVKSKGWSAVVTNVGKTDAGDLHIDITIRNETFDWSAMQADQHAALKTVDGKTTNCDTVFVGTGGHRLAPGFQVRGYTAGTKAQPKTQLIYVECKGVQAAPGSTLSIDYSYVTGMLNYFEQDANKASGTLVLNLDQVATGQTYPVAEQVEGLIQKSDVKIDAINLNVLTLIDVQHTDTGLQFTWQNSNPSAYPLKVHIGNPPVIGDDGIIYGYYEIMDLESPPITPAGGTIDWTTAVLTPKDVKGFYILLSFESGKQRQYANRAIDITDK
jgi:hypothetical protein